MVTTTHAKSAVAGIAARRLTPLRIAELRREAVAERVQEGDEVVDLRVAEAEVAELVVVHRRRDFGRRPRTRVTRVVEVDDAAQVGEVTVVTVGSRLGDVAQRRHAELAVLGGVAERGAEA